MCDAQHPVAFLVLNNSGYISIRDGQNHLMGRQIGSEFNKHTADGQAYSVDFVSLAKSSGSTSPPGPRGG
jgi:acetolactate synthase-1/2/3 large subunit